MPKQVYVYPGNINAADTIEGLRTVLEPAVDTVYTFDQTTGAYVDVNDANNILPDMVYLERGSGSGSRSRLQKYHHTQDLVDANGRKFIPAIYTDSSYIRYRVIKVDPTQSQGYSIVETGNLSAGTAHYFQDAHIKTLWDDANQTIFIVIKDAVFWSTNSYDRNQATSRAIALVKYDKSADTVSVIQEIADTSILRSYPISEILFYYDSGSDAWTFYQPRLGYNGALTLRKIVATQSSITVAAEAITLTGASFTPKFPDALSDPMNYYTRTGLNLRKSWIELSAALDANSTSFTIAVPDSPNIDTGTSIPALLQEMLLKFLRGTWTYDSGSGSWTFSVSSELSMDAPVKQILVANAKFLNNKKAVPITLQADYISSTDEQKFLSFVQLDHIASVATLSDVTAYVYTKKIMYSGIPFVGVVKGTVDASGNFVISHVYPEVTPYGDSNFIAPTQVDTTTPPPILFTYKGGSANILINVNSSQVVALAPNSLKYLYDISNVSTSGNRYYIINRIQSDRLYPYIFMGQDLQGTTKKVIVVHDRDAGSADYASSGTFSMAYNDGVSGAPALNYSAGGTITSVYNRTGSGLESLTYWLRSGSTMYPAFTLFVDQLSNNSFLKYIADNTNIDKLFVVRNKIYNSSRLFITSAFSNFYHVGNPSSSATNDNVPSPLAGIIDLHNAGIDTSIPLYGTSIYYNPASNEFAIDKNDTADSVVLSSLVLIGSRITQSANAARVRTNNFVSSNGVVATLFSSYFLQIFRNYWSADYEDTLEVNINGTTYKFVVIGKYSLNGTSWVTVVLEDVV